MKKILFFTSALAGLLLAGSCQREEFAPVTEGNVVTFEVGVPEVATKAVVNDGSNINDLVYAVYRTSATNLEAAQSDTNLQLIYQKNYSSDPFQDGKAIVPIELINDQNYLIVFWAQVNDAWVAGDDFNLLDGINYPTQMNANDNALAAFTNVSFLSAADTKGGAIKRDVELSRPFAQVNIGTTLPKNVAETVELSQSSVKVTGAGEAFNPIKQAVVAGTREVEFVLADVPGGQISVNNVSYEYAAMNYIFANGNVSVAFSIVTKNHGTVTTEEIPAVPVQTNYRTNIVGNLLTSEAEYSVTLEEGFYNTYNVDVDGSTSVTVTNTKEFKDAFENENIDVIILNKDINLNEISTADPTYAVANGKTLTIDLNNYTLSAASAQAGKNYELFLVKGDLTVKNGSIEYEHKGENMGWNKMTCIFDVTAGGVLNLAGVTAKNLGGSDMCFVAHLNNWGEVTLNAENSTLESNYVAVRVFNSGNDMNNVTIKNSTLKGGSYAFWVHNYTVEDFGTTEKAEAHKALLNLNIYNQGNTLSGGVRYGFTNKIVTDGNGITKTVSEDGSVVTLGTMVENGVVARYAAGEEKNNTVTKVVVGEGIASLPDRTFYRYFALETVELPSTLTILGTNGEDYYSNGNVFQGCAALKNITIPESVTTLGMGTFYGCTSLTSINIPSGVTRIEENALRETGLVSVEFHKGVTYFGAQAFRDCKQLKEVYINAPEFTIEPNAFGSMAAPYPPVTIYVANTEMKEYLESTLTYANQFSIVVPGLVNTVDELKAALADETKDIITLAAGTTFEGTFEINRNVKIVSERADNKSVIKGRVNVVNSNPTFVNVSFDRNDSDSNADWNTKNGQSNCLKYKAVVMIYGDQLNKVTFNQCNFYNNNGTNKSAITNTAVELVIDDCYFEGLSSSIYSQANLSVTNSTFNYTGTDNVILSINGCGDNGGKVIFKNNYIKNKILALSQFLSTTEFGNGTYHFDVQGNTGEGFDYYFLNESRVTNKTFAEGSLTF